MEYTTGHFGYWRTKAPYGWNNKHGVVEARNDMFYIDTVKTATQIVTRDFLNDNGGLLFNNVQGEFVASMRLLENGDVSIKTKAISERTFVRIDKGEADRLRIEIAR